MSDEQTPKSPTMSAKARTTEPSAKIADLIGYWNQLELTGLVVTDRQYGAKP